MKNESKHTDVHKENIVLPTEMDSEALAEYVASESVGILKRFDVLKPYFQELWKRFDALKEGEVISGCRTRTEFCEKVLHRSRRSVQYILYGRPPAKPYAPTADKPPSELTNEELIQRWNGCRDTYLAAGFPASTPNPTAAPPTHPSERCPNCPASFPSKTKMKQHRLEVHNIGAWKQYPSADSPSDNRNRLKAGIEILTDEQVLAVLDFIENVLREAAAA